MLFIAITRAPLGESFGHCNFSTIGNLTVSYEATGHLSHVEMSDQQVHLEERCNQNLGKSSCLASICLNLKIPYLSVKCPTIGGRTLYYHQDNNGQFFCSTHIGMLRKASIEIRENQAVLPEYFLYRCVMPPNTMYQDIFQIMLGGQLEISFANTGIKVIPGFFEPPAPSVCRTLVDAAQQIKDRLAYVFKANTTESSKVLLSGGIDSSIMFKLAQQQVGVQHSYSSAYPFEKAELNIERRYATTASATFGSEHQEFIPSTVRYREAIIESIAAAELPLHHLQSPIMYLFCKDCFAESNEPIVNGIGAGGSFGNFRNFLYYRRRPKFRLLNNSLGRLFLKLTSRLTGRGNYQLAQIQEARGSHRPPSDDDSIWQWHAYGNIDWIRKRLGTEWNAVIGGPASTLQHYYSMCTEDIWSLYSLLGDETATINIWSKLAEACGNTMLFPMYDHEVLNMALELSWSEKLAPPENRLRKKIAELCGVRDDIIDRPKSGFGVERQDWALADGPFDPLVTLAAKAVDIEWIRELQSQEPKLAMTFWNLINYGIWKRIAINGESYLGLLEELKHAESAGR